MVMIDFNLPTVTEQIKTTATYDLQRNVIAKALISKENVAQLLLEEISQDLYTDEHLRTLASGIIKVGTNKQKLADHTGIDLVEIQEIGRAHV